MALLPRRLGAHEAGRGLRQLRVERGLPLVRAHARGVAAERRRANAREVVLARLAAAAAAELDRVAVDDPVVVERVTQPSLVELRVAARAGKAAHVDERLHAGVAQRFGQFLERANAVADGEHMHTIVASMVGGRRWPIW